MTKLRGRVVTPHGVWDDGVVEVEGDRIVAVSAVDGAPDPDASWILPGFVDLHVHGGGGHTFTDGDPAAARDVAGFHLRHGTTTLLASLVTGPFELLRDATVAFEPLVKEGVLAGLHYEGPYLSHLRCGAQNPAFLRNPDLSELTELLDLGGVRMVTIAPELPGAIEAIRLLSDRGVIAAVGHTDATYAQTIAAAQAGASVGTHLSNGMRPIHHREPGPIVALLRSRGVVCELIADGVHLHDGMLGFVFEAAGPGRVALVTDAMAAAGMPDGAYELGGQAVTVADGVARLTAGGAIAGSTLTMDAALRKAIAAGVSMVDAARAAATTPATVLGIRGETGAIEPGLRADIVILDKQLSVAEVLHLGFVVPTT